MEQNQYRPEPNQTPIDNTTSLISILRPMILVVLTATPLMIMMRTLLFIYGYEDALSVWTMKADSIGTLSTWVIVAVAISLAVIPAAMLKKRVPSSWPATTPSVADTFIALFSASLMVVTSIFAVMKMMDGGDLTNIKKLFIVFFPLSGLLSFGGVAYRVFSGDRKGAVSTITGFFPPIWVCLSMLESYFTTGHIINDPVLNGELLSSVFLILFLLAEQRMRLIATAERQTKESRQVFIDGIRMYLSTTAIAASAGLALSLPVLLSALIGPVRFECNMLKIGTECLLSLCAAVRLVSISRKR